MRVNTEEFMKLKMATNLLAHRMDDLSEIEKKTLASALKAIESAEARLKESNRKQADLMKERRKKGVA